MLNFLVHTIACILLVSLTQVMSHSFRLHDSTPNLLLMYVLLISLDPTERLSALISVIAGLYADFLSGTPPGTMAVSYMLISKASGELVKKITFFHRVWWRFPVLVIVATVSVYTMAALWTYGLTLVHLPVINIGVGFFTKLLPYLLMYNILLAYPMYCFHYGIKKILEGIERKQKSGVGL